MKSSRLLQIILNCLIITIFIATGIVVLILRHNVEVYDNIILGIILFIAGGSRLVIYFLNKGYKYSKDISFISSAIMIGLGFVFLFSKKDIEMLCFGWGIMEIVLGLIEVYIDVLEVKEKKLAWFEMAVNVGTIVFGVLLCIKLSEGLTGHIIFLATTLFLHAIITTIKFIGVMREK